MYHIVSDFLIFIIFLIFDKWTKASYSPSPQKYKWSSNPTSPTYPSHTQNHKSCSSSESSGTSSASIKSYQLLSSPNLNPPFDREYSENSFLHIMKSSAISQNNRGEAWNKSSTTQSQTHQFDQNHRPVEWGSQQNESILQFKKTIIMNLVLGRNNNRCNFQE